MRTLNAALMASSLLCACAQLIGTDDYEVDPSAFDDEPSTSRDDSGVRTDGSERDPSDSEPTGLDPTDDGGTGEVMDATSTETTATDTETTETTQETEPPDGGGPQICEPLLGSCGLVPQCGCDEGQLCDVVDANTGRSACLPAGNTPPYAACSFTSGECQVGYACIGGVCKELCDPEVTALCNGRPFESCTSALSSTGDPIPGFNFCQRTCDPRDPYAENATFQPCGEGANCAPGTAGVSFCLIATGNGIQGESCSGPTGPDPFACAPGFSCVLFSADAVCMRNCAVGGNDCERGLSCYSYTSPLSAAQLEIGYCDDCAPSSDGSCDPVTQCGCPESQMCAVIDWSTGATGCLPPGSIPAGGSCSVEIGECEPGAECLEWLENGVCTGYCNQDSDCSHGLPCVEWEIPGINLCLNGCDPRAPSSDAAPFHACQPGQGCTVWSVSPESSVCTTPVLAGVAGDPCTGEEDCSPGFTCGGESGTACARWCAIGSGECSTGEACLPHQWLSDYLDAVVINDVSFGVCTPATIDLVNSASMPIPDADEEAGVVESSIEVSRGPSSISVIEVEVNITHPYVGDVGLALFAPDDTFVILFDSDELPRATLSGANLVATSFEDSAATPITEGLAPFTGSFRPTEPLSTFAGLDANGTWTLVVFDRAATDTGTLDSWRLRIY